MVMLALSPTKFGKFQDTDLLHFMSQNSPHSVATCDVSIPYVYNSFHVYVVFDYWKLPSLCLDLTNEMKEIIVHTKLHCTLIKNSVVSNQVL